MKHFFPNLTDLSFEDNFFEDISILKPINLEGLINLEYNS